MQGICAHQQASRRHVMHALRRCPSRASGAPVATFTTPCMHQPISSHLKPRPVPVAQAPTVRLPPLTPHTPQSRQHQTLRLLRTLARALEVTLEAAGTTQAHLHSSLKLHPLPRVQVPLSHKVRTVLSIAVGKVPAVEECPTRLICLPSFPATRKVAFGTPWV